MVTGQQFILVALASGAVAAAGLLALQPSRAPEARPGGAVERRDDRSFRLRPGSEEAESVRDESTYRRGKPGEGSLASRMVVQQPVTVGGYVRRPGPIPYKAGQTVAEGIVEAGGASEFGSLARVRIFRDGKVRQLDLTQEGQGEFKLMPSDTIEVPQKMILGR